MCGTRGREGGGKKTIENPAGKNNRVRSGGASKRRERKDNEEKGEG